MNITNRGAGCIFRANQTNRILLQKRSADSSEGGTWGSWGGGSEVGETPIDTMMREVQEEAGYDVDPSTSSPLMVFEDPESGFSYHNFLVTVEDEFDPTINGESDGWGWFPVDGMPDPLHFGLQAVFSDADSLAAIEGGYGGMSQEIPSGGMLEMNHTLYRYRRSKHRSFEKAIKALVESGIPYGVGERGGESWVFIGYGFPKDLHEDRLDLTAYVPIHALLEEAIDQYCDGVRNPEARLAALLEMSSTCGMSITPAVASTPTRGASHKSSRRSVGVGHEDDEDEDY